MIHNRFGSFTGELLVDQVSAGLRVRVATVQP
jgi:hypothetical protein